MSMRYTRQTWLQKILSSLILIVDDNKVNCYFLEEILRARGFTRFVTASTAQEALQKLDQHQPDIVLLDVMMPDDMDGFECCEVIRRNEKYRDLPILMQTVITEPEMRAKAFRKGATDFVSKPVHPDELGARVMVHLEKSHSLKSLQMYQARIQAELDSARLLQQAILPGPEDITTIRQKSHLDVAAYFEPCSEIGGDFWGIRSLFSQQSALWLVDFSGHGVAAALNAFRLQAYMKEHSSLVARPGEYMSHLNDSLLQLLLRGQFATMFYAVIDTQGNHLYYTCACAPSPMIYRQATGDVEILDGSGRPLGVGMNLYQTSNTSFGPGDKLVLYSDAYLEAQGSDGSVISEEKMADWIRQCAHGSSNVVLRTLLNNFRHHAGEILFDDLTLIVCGHEGREES